MLVLGALCLVLSTCLVLGAWCVVLGSREGAKSRRKKGKSWRSSVVSRRLAANSLLPTDYKLVLRLWSLRSFAAI
jgi:hypothetical protein